MPINQDDTNDYDDVDVDEVPLDKEDESVAEEDFRAYYIKRYN